MNESGDGRSTSIFVGGFELFNVDTDEEGSFEIVVEAGDVFEAAARCRARLDEIADSSDSLGPIEVHLNAFVRLVSDQLQRGALVHMSRAGKGSDISFYDPLPGEERRRDSVHFNEDLVADGDPTADDDAPAAEEPMAMPPFWRGVDSFRAKWKLFWCETDDHDEDWFVVARDEDEATQFHEDQEGYDEDEASAQFVCVLPASEQKEHEAPWWPEDRTLLACGAELLPYVPQDGQGELRETMGSGGRVVQIKGRVYAEGDIVSNTLGRFGGAPES